MDQLPKRVETRPGATEITSLPKSWLSLQWDFSDEFARLEKAYQRRKRAVVVNFRKLVPMHSGVDRATHLLHSYPAKLLTNIPVFFLNCEQLRTRGGLVVDPFCGTGTVLLEAILAGHNAIGADANPLARLIAKAKLHSIDRAHVDFALAKILSRANRIKPARFYPVVDVDKWFTPGVVRGLGRLIAAIREIKNTSMRRFMEVCFSNCVRKASLADPHMSVPVRRRGYSRRKRVDVFAIFERCVRINSERLESLRLADPNLLRRSRILLDARKLGQGKPLNADLIITSPPYLGAQKYVRASSLSIGWLGLAPKGKLRNLEKLSIGREHFSKSEYAELQIPNIEGVSRTLRRLRKINALRAHIAATYLKEMREALLEACRNLRSGGHFVLVIGDNTVCGSPFRTSRYLRTILTNSGLTIRLELIDEIRSRGLMTKRNKTAGLISREHIFVFRKD